MRAFPLDRPYRWLLLEIQGVVARRETGIFPKTSLFQATLRDDLILIFFRVSKPFLFRFRFILLRLRFGSAAEEVTKLVADRVLRNLLHLGNRWSHWVDDLVIVGIAGRWSCLENKIIKECMSPMTSGLEGNNNNI